MSKGNTTENDVLQFIFNDVLPAWDTDTDLFIALHSADPGEAGTQATNEISYTGYTRLAIVRTPAGWTVAGSLASNTALIQFGECTAGSATVTHASLGRAVSGASQIIYSGALNASRAISAGIQPQFAIGACQITED